MNQKIENQGNYNININGVKGDININSPEALKYLQELNSELVKRLAVSQEQINTLLQIIKNQQNGKSTE